jgi:hypothetical protein
MYLLLKSTFSTLLSNVIKTSVVYIELLFFVIVLLIL